MKICGLRGWGCKTYKKRYHALFLGLLKPGKFHSLSGTGATIKLMWICIKDMPAHRLCAGIFHIHICVRLLRCPFYSEGQFQGLNKQNGLTVQTPRFFIF